jgi:hypothetical protein
VRTVLKGWLSFCPIYVVSTDGWSATLMARWWVLTPLMWLARWWQEASMGLCKLVNPSWEPRYNVRITGRVVVRD